MSDLDALALEGATLDDQPKQDVAQLETGVETPPQVDPVQSLAGLLSLVGVAADMAKLDRTAAIWSPETCNGMASRAVPVLVKYPWGQKFLDFLNTGAGVEAIALAMYAVPVLLATRAALAEDMKPAAKPEPDARDTAAQA